jgi:hypothetical protein
MPLDRVLSGAPDGRLYRIIAGEAFSWTTLLIEDQLGERFIFDTVSRGLTPIRDDYAHSLIDSRSYRPWNGPQRWSSIGELAPAPSWSTRHMDLPPEPDPSSANTASG